MSAVRLCYYLLLLTTCISGLRIVDLTHAHSDETIAWPTYPDINHTILYRGMYTDFWLEQNYYRTPDHAGTHLDAPAHFKENAERTHSIPMEKLVGPGVVINVKEKVKINKDYLVSVQDLVVWESKYGQIPKGAVVLMNSGWDKFHPNKSLVFGTRNTTDPNTFHFPSFHEDAADWLVKNRKIHILGVDTPSTDFAQSATYPVHLILAKAGISGLENVANLDMIPEHGTMVFAAVFKLYDGSGGPTRVFATIDDLPTNGCEQLVFVSFLNMFVCLIVMVAFS